jgi:enamine deaminase RidA (YjgF/YER057c/UK114 family)
VGGEGVVGGDGHGAGAAGGEPRHITRLTWYVTDKKAYLARQREVGEAYRRVMGRHFPVMTMVVVAGLIEDEALVEIEATAVISPPGEAR